MQKSFSLNNFGVSPSAFNPGDGVSEVVQSLSHQRGKKKQNTKQTEKTSKKPKPKPNQNKNPKFKWNFNPSASSSSSVFVSSKEEKKREKKKRAWRQLCEFLSEAAAHLPAAVNQLLLEALLIADLRSELSTHLAPQALFTQSSPRRDHHCYKLSPFQAHWRR
jgi:hypothetical protein